MVYIKAIKARTHEEIAEKVEKLLRDKGLSIADCTFEYSTAANPDWLSFFSLVTTWHYVVIFYEKEE